jgi:hypothetical protein
MPVHRTRNDRRQNARIDSRTFVLLFKCYEQLCLHEAILTYDLGTSAIWSGGQAVPHRRLVHAAGLGVRRPQRSRIIPSFYVHPCRCLCTLVPCSLGATVSTKRCRLRRLEYSFTGGSRLGKREEGVHYDPPLRRHIRIDGGTHGGSRVHTVSFAMLFCS